MASSSLSSASKTLSLPLREYPSINRFALDYVSGSGRAASFLSRSALESIRPSGTPRGQDALAAALVSSNLGWGNDVGQEVGRWNRGESIALVAGQQVTFGGGAIYTLAKIASLIRLREDFAARGIDSTIFFWMATEDADFSEAASVWLQTPGGEMTPIRPESTGSGRKVVGTLPVPETLRETLARAIGGPDAPWLRPGISFGESFALLLAEAFRGRGIVLVDSLLPELRRGGLPLFRALLESLPEAEQAIASRSESLRAAGYSPQVATAPDGHYSLLFRIDELGARDAIRRDEHGWRIGGRRADHDTVFSIPPERISTAALARPLLQDSVFRPDVFLGGPAEVAYYAQVAPLHEMMGIAPARVGLRGHALLAPAKRLAVLDAYGIEPRELFGGAEAIVERLDPRAGDRMQQAVDEAAAALEEQFGRISALALEADRGLDRSVGRSLKRIRYHFEKLGERGRRAALRFDRERYDAVRRLCDVIAPQGQPQDRIASWLRWWLVFGPALVDRVVADIEPDSDRVRIIGL